MEEKEFEKMKNEGLRVFRVHFTGTRQVGGTAEFDAPDRESALARLDRESPCEGEDDNEDDPDDWEFDENEEVMDLEEKGYVYLEEANPVNF